jgi:threonyl-tRNA synthetase
MAKDKKDKGAAGGVTKNTTAKFAVLDCLGVKQPELERETAAASSSGALKQGGQGRRAKAGSGPKIGKTGISIGGDSFAQREKNPTWLSERSATYESIKARRAQELATKTPVPLKVTLPDGKVLEKDKKEEPFLTWKTTPYQVAVCISQGLADNSTVARVTYEAFCADYSPSEDGMEGEDMLSDAMADGGIESSAEEKAMLWDMTRPLVGTVAKMEFLKFDNDKDAKTVFWHSSAHMMGEALEHLFGCKLTIGPPLAGGFYYDSYMGSSDALREDDCKSCTPTL